MHLDPSHKNSNLELRSASAHGVKHVNTCTIGTPVFNFKAYSMQCIEQLYCTVYSKPVPNDTMRNNRDTLDKPRKDVSFNENVNLRIPTVIIATRPQTLTSTIDHGHGTSDQLLEISFIMVCELTTAFHPATHLVSRSSAVVSVSLVGASKYGVASQ